jgi:hypothetical protein
MSLTRWGEYKGGYGIAITRAKGQKKILECALNMDFEPVEIYGDG